MLCFFFFFFQAEDGIRDTSVTGVQTCALPILVDVLVLRAKAERQPARVLQVPHALDEWLVEIGVAAETGEIDRKSTRLNSSHRCISYAVFCLKKKKKERTQLNQR